MVEIFAAGTVTLWVLLAVALLTGWVPTRPALGAGVAYLIVLSAAAALNFELGIIPQKEASTFSFDVFASGFGQAQRLSNFVPQAILNLPGFVVTGRWWAAIGGNCALLAFGLMRTWHLKPIRLLWFAPAVLNFGIFSLRDPLIGMAMLGVALGVAGRVRRRTRLASGVVLFFSRPEAVIPVFVSYLEMARRSLSNPKLRVLLVPLVTLTMVGLLGLAPRLLAGQQAEVPESIVEQLDFVDSFAVSRIDRNSLDAGGGSNILSGRLTSLPTVVRFPIQVVAFFFLPFPWEIRTATMALAALDSAFFILMSRRLWPSMTKEQRLLFWLYVLSVSFFAGNYGNLFRLRMPAYFILAAAAVDSVRSDQLTGNDALRVLPSDSRMEGERPCRIPAGP